ncbi:polysaccharide deacetylase family protein [Chryseobacterium hispalense]|uniref:hypothetical protein n=1 Tax=Chryseobacterium hispalense TaxID=1453492 RepID=UPI0004930BA6|nr:hypothetical protein [Chryseobacterium hispalense]
MAKLILTSDDFGLSKIYNEQMLRMLQLKLLSSVSIMVKRIDESQKDQIEELRILYVNQNFSIGLHLEISEDDDEQEYQKQWQDFESKLHLKPDYVDIHKGHLFSDQINCIASFCLDKDVCFRHYIQTTKIVKSPKESRLATYSDLETIKRWIDNLIDNKTYELIFHIGSLDPKNLSSLNKERELDIHKLKWVYHYIRIKKLSVVNFKDLLE